MNPDADVVIMGAGLTGLAAARRLQKEGRQAILLEQGDRSGGAITTLRQDGYLLEQGPSTLLRGSPLLETILAETGLLDELCPPNPSARRRYVVRRGQPCPLPSSPVSFLFSSWLSGAGKWRLLREPLARRGTDALRQNETVAAFTRRRLGPEVLDYGVNPFVSGIYAGDPENLSARLAFPRLYEAESRGGSLLRGFIRMAREARKARGKTPRPPRGTISFREGLAALPRALERGLTQPIRYGERLQSITRDGTAWSVVTSRQTYRTANVLLTSWNPAWAEAAPSPPGGSWPAIAMSAVQVVNLGYARSTVDHPLDGFGILVPACENLPFLGVIFASSLFPGRAPEGNVLLNLFLGGARSPEAASASEEEIRKTILPAVHHLLGIRAEPVFLATRQWDPAIPQYTPDHEAFLDARTAWEGAHPGLFLAGTSVDGISMPQALESGDRAAAKILARLSGETP